MLAAKPATVCAGVSTNLPFTDVRPSGYVSITIGGPPKMQGHITRVQPSACDTKSFASCSGGTTSGNGGKCTIGSSLAKTGLASTGVTAGEPCSGVLGGTVTQPLQAPPTRQHLPSIRWRSAQQSSRRDLLCGAVVPRRNRRRIRPKPAPCAPGVHLKRTPRCCHGCIASIDPG
jgi:hypothetical protein